jgi:hypothetical protein
MKSLWTEQRLGYLFVRYNRRFWCGRLPKVRVCAVALEGHVGEWDAKVREIRIDVRHQSDREIRSTMLHEMAHLATNDAAGPDHGSKFWAQIESLLRQKAPLTIGFPEAPQVGYLVDDAIPKCFPLSRQKLNRLSTKEQRRLEREFRESDPEPIILKDQDIVEEFGDNQQTATRPWRVVLWAVGGKYGLIDVDGKAKNRRASRIIKQGRKAHQRVRREYLEGQRFRRQFEARLKR